MFVVTLAALAGCTEVSLNDAPIIDKSTARGVPTAAASAVPADAAYTVQRGDTLYRIAQNFHCSVQDLVQWNALTESTPLAVGQQLRVRAPVIATPVVPVQAVAAPAPVAPPSPTEPEASAVPIPITDAVQTRTLDTAPGPGAAPPGVAPSVPPVVASASPPASTSAAAVAAPGAPAIVAPGVSPNSAAGGPGAGWIWPVEGRVTVPFDPAHGKGIDIAVADGAPVLAVADGEVSYTGSPRDYGNLVILRHGTELLSVYAHNKSIAVTQGQQVKRGQTIATAGKTGDAPGVLHFEVRRKGVPVDPLDYLPVR
jgi:lipoprotein NlpD